MSCWTGYAAGSREGDPADAPDADGEPTVRAGGRGSGGAGRAPLAAVPSRAAAGRGTRPGRGGAYAAVQPRQRLRVGGALAGARDTGLREGNHGGGRAKLGAAGEAALAALLDEDPQSRGYQATGWTVPMLRRELAQAGCAVGERTIRRALHRVGYRWKRPQYVLGRPDPAYAEKKGP
jgi:transposase